MGFSPESGSPEWVRDFWGPVKAQKEGRGPSVWELADEGHGFLTQVQVQRWVSPCGKTQNSGTETSYRKPRPRACWGLASLQAFHSRNTQSLL